MDEVAFRILTLSFSLLTLGSLVALIFAGLIIRKSRKTLEQIFTTQELYEAGVTCAASAKVAFKTNKNEQTMHHFMVMLDNYEEAEEKFRKSRIKSAPKTS